MLIWISGALSPKDVRDKLTSDDSEFKAELIAYLESSHVGEFLTGSMEDMKDKFVPREGVTIDDPTQRLPVPPPPASSCLSEEGCACEDCRSEQEWLQSYKETVDNIVY
jgi:hypothetical protein